MIEVHREPDDVSVLISGKEVVVEDAGDHFVLAECDLADLEHEAAQPFPEGLTLQVRSEDGFGTYLFHELDLVGAAEGVELAFRCHTPNKYWEGQYGLATFLAAIRDQVPHHGNGAVSRIELEDEWKGITLSRTVAIGDPLHGSIQTAAADLKALIHAAEVALSGLGWRHDARRLPPPAERRAGRRRRGPSGVRPSKIGGQRWRSSKHCILRNHRWLIVGRLDPCGGYGH